MLWKIIINLNLVKKPLYLVKYKFKNYLTIIETNLETKNLFSL